MSRIIGIRPRVKVLIDQTPSPTQLMVYKNGQFDKPEKLKTEDEELKFVNSLEEGDVVLMLLGGSGDYLAFALARHGEKVGAKVYRVAPHVFQSFFGSSRDKDDDSKALIQLYLQNPELFYIVTTRQREIILLRELLRSRIDAMKARIACEQRLRQRLIGMIFCGPEGYFPEGDIEKEFDKFKANDDIYVGLDEEEKRRNQELIKHCLKLQIYKQIFEPILGCGPMVASRIISAVIDIRRFPSATKFKAFCGVHLRDGKFPRKRSGSVANWNNDCRQALYLLGDQFNRRPDSFWGQKLREVKASYRIKHPEIVTDNGKKRYTNGHIHQMALWYTLGKFTLWLYREWSKFEEEQAVMQD